MKQISFNIFRLILLSLSFVSCKKDFLEIQPKMKMIASSLRDYELLMNNPSFYSVSYGFPGISMGDDMAAEAGRLSNASLLNQRAFAWEDVLFQPTQDPIMFDIELGNLFMCNKIVAEVNEATASTELQRKSLESEARATRAWIHFQFINHYAKPYKETTASSDSGFPIITTADISVKSFNRSTVKQVYDFIISDLSTAIPNLPVTNVIPTRMSRPAAKGLLGKVYLFMGKYPEALEQFNGAFADLASSSSPATLYNYNDTFGPNGSFLPLGYYGPNYPGNNSLKFQESILLKTGYTNGSDFANSGLVISPETMALFGASDLRLNFYSQQHSDMTPLPQGLFLKYAAQYTHTGLELADLILMRAEVKARLNDLTGAKTDVEMLRKNRISGAAADVPSSISNQLDLLKFIIDERQREFAGEGYRWLDMRRLSVDPMLSMPQFVHHVYGANGINQITKTYQLKTERLTLRLPQSIIDANPGMPNNP